MMLFIIIFNHWSWVQGGQACIEFPDNLQEPAATSTFSHQVFMQFSHFVFVPVPATAGLTSLYFMLNSHKSVATVMVHVQNTHKT